MEKITHLTNLSYFISATPRENDEDGDYILRFEVISMNPVFRSIREEHIHRVRNIAGTVYVRSVDCPEIRVSRDGRDINIYLQGFDTYSDSIASSCLVSADKVRYVVARIHAALRDWNENWEGWARVTVTPQEVDALYSEAAYWG